MCQIATSITPVMSVYIDILVLAMEHQIAVQCASRRVANVQLQCLEILSQLHCKKDIKSLLKDKMITNGENKKRRYLYSLNNRRSDIYTPCRMGILISTWRTKPAMKNILLAIQTLIRAKERRFLHT